MNPTSHILISLAFIPVLAGPLHAQHIDTSGTGWRLSRLDLDVSVHPAVHRIEVESDVVVRLVEHAQSSRLVLALNSRDTSMAFDSVTVAGGSVESINSAMPGRPAMRVALIDLEGAPRSRGEEIRVRVYSSSRTANVQQFTLAADVALASWVTAWYPIPVPTPGVNLGAMAKAPGETRFDLPVGWRAVSNGTRVESRTENGRVVERWVTEAPLARSFAAAPYRVVAGEAKGRRVELFLLTIADAEAHVQAAALAASIAALERRFGPYPTSSYAIAEVPEWVPGFLAASEQGFMMAKPENFRVRGGNIPLFAHEAAHGYWGNLVSSDGPGSSFLTESISQYGAVIAIEEILGPSAALEFLRFSREGYIALQSARGFFEVVRRGADSVAIAEMQNLSGTAKRIVVDSKGTWIYHMLRRRLGDELFFRTLQEYLRAHRVGSSTLATFREFVARAAPDKGTREFFNQWLDRTGAPRLGISWASADGFVVVTVEQEQREEPFHLDLDVQLEAKGGSRAVHTVRIDSRRHEFRLPFSGAVTSVTLDPEFKIFRWDEAYRTSGR